MKRTTLVALALLLVVIVLAACRPRPWPFHPDVPNTIEEPGCCDWD